jgi:hypothetical protein
MTARVFPRRYFYNAWKCLFGIKPWKEHGLDSEHQMILLYSKDKEDKWEEGYLEVNQAARFYAEPWSLEMRTVDICFILKVEYHDAKTIMTAYFIVTNDEEAVHGDLGFGESPLDVPLLSFSLERCQLKAGC